MASREYVIYYVYIYIYTHIERGREEDRERKREKENNIIYIYIVNKQRSHRKFDSEDCPSACSKSSCLALMRCSFAFSAFPRSRLL